MKKRFFVTILLLVLSASFVNAISVSSRAEGGFISINGSSFEGKSSSYINLRQTNGKCYGHISFNFKGGNENSTARLSIRMRVKKLNCLLGNDLIFISGNANIFYRTNQKHKRVFDYLTPMGYSKWKWIKTGKKSFYRGHDNVIILLTSDGLSIYSDNFGIYNMQLYNYKYRE